MSNSVTKSTLLFLAPEDEVRFEQELRRCIPDIRFVDGSNWKSEAPPAKNTLADCSNTYVYLWSPSACPKLPYAPRPGGGFQGPNTGVVVQFARSRRIDKVLGSGRLAIGYDKSDTAVADFVKIVWKVLTSMKSEKLSSFSDTTHQLLEEKISGFVVGPAASDFSRKGGLLKNIGSVGYYYKVVD